MVIQKKIRKRWGLIADPIADLLTRLRNANTKFHEQVELPHSRIKENILRVLKEEGFIANTKRYEDEGKPMLRVYMRYTPERKQVIVGLQRVSRPSLHIYRGAHELPRLFSGIGVSILSTSRGILTAKKAHQMKIGGEVLCTVW